MSTVNPPKPSSNGQAQTQGPPVVAPLVSINESLRADGTVKELWRYVLDGVATLGPEGLDDRHQKARRILRDDGATYTVYSNSGGVRAWELDLVPLLLGSDEWARIESGLLERAELFNLILTDLYGPRDLIRTGVIPPEVVLAHGGFLRACDGIKLPGAHQLIIHSVDMGRMPDGNFCVFADRTQSPSGAGYALENRTVMSRVLPSMFRDSHVHRLAHFFQRLRFKLNQLAEKSDQPRVVVLTPGALNETHFEHAYLANYLGYPLVQSGDLVVRNGFVWMKSLEGLSRVDVILRRVDDWYCDPLELRSDSHLGVPGLLEVARMKRVAIANPLGSGVLESPALLKYLPQIGRMLLGRDLRLPSVKTFWCGDAKDLKVVKDRFEELVIKPVYRGSGLRSQCPCNMSVKEKQALWAQIQAQPNQFVAQERILLSHAPTMVGSELVPRPAILRSFAVASDSSYSVMPGGLTRVGSEENGLIISNQLGSVNKDTWVVASEPERPTETEAVTENTIDPFQYTSLPSRVVENLFWLGRYAERAEASLRMLRTVFVFMNGAEPLPEHCKKLLLRAVTETTGAFPGFKGEASVAAHADPEKELLEVILDATRLGSVRGCLNAMLNCAEESKELLSSDSLRVTNDIRDVLDDLDEALQGGLAAAPEEALDPLVTALMALSGLMNESMIRGVGWRFMEIGRRLERGMQTVMLIRTLLVPALEEAEEASVMSAMLLTLEALITYRRRYRGRTNVAHGLELCLIDTSNPRSLLYQFEQLQKHIDDLPEIGISSRELLSEQRAVFEAISNIRLSHLVDLAHVSDETNKREKLDQTLGRLYHLLGTIGAVVSDKYFDHRVEPQQLVRAVWEG